MINLIKKIIFLDFSKYKNKVFKKARKGAKEPRLVGKYIALRLKGYYYKFKFKLAGKHVQIGSHFKVKSKLLIKGPGKVIFGNNVLVDGTLHPVTPFTYSKGALIFIGDGVFLNGTRFACRSKIEIGEDSIIADCRIMDTDFHSIIPSKRNDPKYIRTEPIKIGRNVWIGLDCLILKGVRIGDNATIMPKSLVLKDIPENSLCGGNPAAFIKRIPME
jgi:acetyltransferase-like isoleucine patch superfamily enzyme